MGSNKNILISVFCPVFSGSTFFCMQLEAALKQYKSLFIGEINRLNIPGNSYRESDLRFQQTKTIKTARELILNYNSTFWQNKELTNFSEAFSHVFNQGHRVIIEDSKHQDWHGYIRNDTLTQREDIEWINVILFRQPSSWLNSFRKVTELTESDAILGQYVRQYKYYEDNLRSHPTETIYISFENFIKAPLGVFTKLKKSIDKRLKDTYRLSQADDTPLPNAIGGNIKAYLSCSDFPSDLSKENSIYNIHSIVERFFFDLCPQHNKGYADSLIENYGTQVRFSNPTESQGAKNIALQNVSITARRIVESIYKQLMNKATNCSPI